MKNKILYFVLACSLVSTLQADSLTILKAYQLSLENANDIKSSKYQLEANKEKVNQTQSQLYPQINFTASRTKTDFEINSLQSRTEYDIKEISNDYAISLSQVLYNKDILTKIDMERTRVELQNIKFTLQKYDVSQQVLRVYLDILKAQNTIKLYESYVKFNKAKLETVEKKYEMQLANKMDLLQMRVEYNTSKIDLTKELKYLEIHKLKLTQFIGTNNFYLPKMNFEDISLDKIKQMQNSIVNNNNFKESLQIQQALVGQKLTQQEIENSLSGYHPKVSMNARYTKYDSIDSSTDYENIQRISLQLEIPIYQGGYRTSRVLATKLNNKAAKEDLIKVKKDVQIKYDELLTLFNTSIISLDLYAQTLQSSQLYYDSIVLGFDNGLKSMVDLRDAQKQVYEVKYKYAKNIYDVVESYVGLLAVLNKFDNLKYVDEMIQ